MEVTKFLNILKKHKYGIMAIPVLVMLLTFFLVRKLPDVYTSKARLSAGLTDGSQIIQENQNVQESKINQEFTNLIQTIQLKKVFNQISYQLILHDLTAEEPFRPPSKLLKQLNENARKHAVEVYTRMYTDRMALSYVDIDQKGLAEVIKSMNYHYDALYGKIKIYRVENSDFIDIEYDAENPQLSEFVVNTLSKEFIRYYSELTNANGLKAIGFLGDLLNKKKDTLNLKTESLKNYKIQQKVLNLNEQAKSLYAQISDFETRLELAQKEVDANKGAIREIDAKFNPQDKQYAESRMQAINNEIMSTQDQLNQLNDQYIKTNFDKNIKAKIDGLRETIKQKIDQAADRNAANPLTAKNSLIAQKLKLSIDLELASSSIPSLKFALANLHKRLDMLVPHEAVIQSYESDIAVAGQEYMEILKKYNQTNMDFNASIHVKQIEIAAPGQKQPSKKLILVILSGLVCFIFYVLILFIIFYLDESVKVPMDLYNKTDLRVLGFLPVVVSSLTEIQKLWSIEPPGNEVRKLLNSAKQDLQRINPVAKKSVSKNDFKRLIRATRFEINMALMGGRNLVITSMVEDEGKTLVSLSLVSAYQMMNKKVMLIDGNFLNPAITEITRPKFFIEDYLTGAIPLEHLTMDGNVCVLGNYGNDISLFEIDTEFQISQKLLELKDVFDIIIIEASALSTLNQCKEWIVVADRVLSVYEANTNITHEKKIHVEYLKLLEGTFIGWILNKVTEKPL